MTANTSASQIYTLNEPRSRDLLKRQSGERVDFNRSFSMNHRGEESQTDSEFRSWHLTDDHINDINDLQLGSLLHINSGEPSAPGERVQQMQGLFPVFRWQHEEYRRMPLPNVPQPELKGPTVLDQPTRHGATDAGRKGTSDRFSPIDAELQERMAEAWAALEREAAAN